MAGVELADLPLDRALNVLTAMAVDDAMPVVTVETRKGVEVYDRRRVRGDVLAGLRGKGTEVPTGGGQVPTVRRQAAREEWNRETWGLLPEHQAGVRAAMSFAAGLGG